MPLYSTKFHISWLEKLDSDGTLVERWLKRGTSHQYLFVHYVKPMNYLVVTKVGNHLNDI
jgi:hypothetical protein